VFPQNDGGDLLFTGNRDVCFELSAGEKARVHIGPGRIRFFDVNLPAMAVIPHRDSALVYQRISDENSGLMLTIAVEISP
jgi:hypothetical protein